VAADHRMTSGIIRQQTSATPKICERGYKETGSTLTSNIK